MEINVLDTSEEKFLRVKWQLEAVGKTTIETVDFSNAVDRMIDDVIRVAKTPNSITVLRLYAHGNAGIINVRGFGQHGKKADPESRACVAIENLPKLEASLRRLAPYFAPGARVELIGCLVALDTEGEELLRELARIWGVRVQGSPDASSVLSIELSGRVYEATPDGGLLCVERTEMTVESPAAGRVQ
jgi:hypothetical protein